MPLKPPQTKDDTPEVKGIATLGRCTIKAIKKTYICLATLSLITGQSVFGQELDDKTTRHRKPEAVVSKKHQRQVDTIPPIPPPASSNWSKIYNFTELRAKKPFEYLAVAHMKLPDGGWQYDVPYTGFPTGYSIDLTGKKNPKLNLRIYSSGTYFTDDRYFKNILKQEPHELSKEERESICISDSFTNSHTENLNGKRVIVMTGHFDHDNEDVYRMEFNHNREASNTVVSGGIEFSAPPAEYKQNLEEMKKAFKTIRWNNVHVYKPD
ncbi:MAG: hypothetical protein WCT03_10155 [Candidatus Obscuribacterales bacterium]|jgi:hypothetical protein